MRDEIEAAVARLQAAQVELRASLLAANEHALISWADGGGNHTSVEKVASVILASAEEADAMVHLAVLDTLAALGAAIHSSAGN